MKKGLIIGGSGEIGSQIAKSMAEAGMNVGVHYHTNNSVVHELKLEVPEGQWEGAFFGDLSTPEGIERFLASMPKEWDMLVFAPGNHSAKLIQDVSFEEMDHYYHIHVKALWMISQALIPSMVRNQQGNIVVISSVWGEEGASTEAIYSSVKGAQISYVKALAKELAPSNIRVNAVTPGFISTKMNAQLSEEDQLNIYNEIPLGRAGTSSEVANGVIFLLKQHSSYITGHTLRINGGWF
ncbi:3-ketoacyl-ACP reductase [Halobacillus andaensis]|uniref:3-ketoacyl-ACP reductase n=1 Tax=Halobacillus andaensis TaxID=1176239 RepID=A0A917ETN3_HALAA|nr:SDR family oxidoreductase [Halobacillus andaensis]MBP2003430.1 3-oxoacyl-[acyl-carrier protein] reductase [Halobacillus andaensis]GGF10535.1 3-ketoacyl-ACP reductase [Halobacillus andaensis]